MISDRQRISLSRKIRKIRFPVRNAVCGVIRRVVYLQSRILQTDARHPRVGTVRVFWRIEVTDQIRLIVYRSRHRESRHLQLQTIVSRLGHLRIPVLRTVKRYQGGPGGFFLIVHVKRIPPADGHSFRQGERCVRVIGLKRGEVFRHGTGKNHRSVRTIHAQSVRDNIGKQIKTSRRLHGKGAEFGVCIPRQARHWHMRYCFDNPADALYFVG